MNVLLLVVALATAAKPPADVETASVGEVPAAKAPVVVVAAVGTAAHAAVPGQPVWEPVVQRGSCGLLALYTRNSFLSGPWGAARRLAAARRLDDADEIRRMEAKLAALLTEALNTEREGDGDQAGRDLLERN